MDPTNQNPISNSAAGSAPANPVAGPAPMPGAEQNANLGMASAPAQNTGAGMPSAALGQSINPAAASAPSIGMGNRPDMPTPVNPIVQPTNPGVASPVAAVPRFEGIAATDPIMKPEPLPEPDPVEEELKAPMKAAEPVPGSIGSAVSGAGEKPVTNPFDNRQSMPGNVPGVGVAEPQPQPNVAGMSPNTDNNLEKKKDNKKTLIILIIVAAVIVVALAIVLIIQLTSSNKTVTPATSSDTGISAGGGGGEIESSEDEEEEVDRITVLSCTRNMTETELIDYAGAISGMIAIQADYGGDLVLEGITMTKAVEYDEAVGDEVEQQPTDVEITQILADEITSQNMGVYYLNADQDGEPLKTLDEMKTNYESLDFSCETL